jgi:two-component system, sensor histidine kinase LadS
MLNPPAIWWVRLVASLLASCVLVGCGSRSADHAGQRVLDRDWQVLVDRTGAMDFDAARFAWYEPLPGSPALGYVEGAVWLRHTLDLTGMHPGERLLDLQLPAIDSATLYWPTPGGTYRVHTAGDMLPMSSRDVRHRNVIFRVDVTNTHETTFFLRVQGTNNQTFSVALWEPAAFFRAALDDQLLWGALLALHAVLLLSNFWLFRATRDAPTGLFVAFICVSFGAIVFTEGFGHAYLFEEHPQINHALLTLFWMLSVPATYAFIFSYSGLLTAGSRWPIIAISGITALSMLAVLIDLILGQAWVRPAFSQLQLCSTVVLCALLAWLSRLGSKPARLLLLGMLPSLTAIGMKMARNLGWVQPSPWIDSAYLFGLAIYLLTLNYGITGRYRALRLEKETAQQAALELAQRNERELESRVSKRTEEIAAAMTRVGHALELERRLISEQRDLYATISHELRTPVTVIDLSMQNLMRHHPAPAPPVLARYRKIMEATARLSDLIGRYLRQDHLSTRRPGPTCRWTRAHELLQDAGVAATLCSNGHGVRMQMDDLSIEIWCDPMLTRLALNNLTENAVKYTPAGTTVHLAARLESFDDRTNAVLEVHDHGPGLSEAALRNILEPGFRIARSSSYGGTGLGLQMARHVIEQQGGSLTVSSNQGEGTIATIRLPQPASVQPVEDEFDARQPRPGDLRDEGAH